MDIVNQHSAPNFFKCLIRLLQPILLLVLWPTFSGAQNFPLQASLQIPSPHSLYLTDYTSPSYPNGIKVSLVLQDFNAQDIEVKLRFKIEGQGIVLETNLDAPLDAVTLSPGVPSFLQGADLTTNLSFQNLRLEGISSAELNRKGGRLPEGFYRVSVTAFVSRRGREIPVSRPALTTLWLTEGDPSLPQESQCGIDIPFNGIEKVINFNWLPIGIHPDQGMRIFNFSLYEHPQGRPVSKAAMEETVRGTRPIYQIESVGTQLSLSTSELGLRYDPDLGASPIYIWRVQVTDSEGRTVYKNDGFSKICYFKLVEENQEWLDKMLYDSLQFKVGALNAYMGYVNFKRGNLNNALRDRILFRYRGADSRDIKDWSPLEMESNNGAVINQLASDFKYEVQMHLLSKEENVQVLTYEKKEEKAQDDGLEWSVSKTFKTFVYHEQVCGEGSKPELLERSNRNPLMELYPKQRIQFSFGNYMTITEVTNHGGGVFSGEGLQEIFGRQVRMAFDNLMLNEDLIVLQGEAYGKQESKYKDMIAKIWQSEINRDREAEYDLNERDDVQVMPFVLRQGSISKVTVLDLGNGNQKILVFNKKGKSFNAGFPPGEGSASKKIIRDDKGNVYTVDKEGNVTKGEGNGGNTGGSETNEADQREKLITEILQYLEQIITAWQDDNTATLPECIPANNDLLSPVLDQIDTYQDKPGELLSKYSSDDQSSLSDHVNTYNELDNLASYQDALSEENWQSISCRTYSYLNDLAQGVGVVADASAARVKLEGFISDYRAAYKQGSTNFTFSSTNFGDVYPTDYTIKGVSSIKVGLVDNRENDDYEPSLSLDYFLEDVTGQKEIAGTNFEASAVFQFGKPGWNFMDGPKFMLYGYHSEPASGLDSKTLLEDYLLGKYDYEAVQNFINKIIDSHDKGEETLNMKGELESQQVYVRNVDFGDKGIYDLYISRTGDFKKDDNSFYSYTKTEVSELFGFTGTYSEYKFYCKSGGVTYIVVPQSQSTTFESSVLKLHSISSGTAHIDLVNAIRAANLNAENKFDITEYGSDGGLSPIFEINHDGEKLKLMVAYPLLGNKKNKIDPLKRPEPTTGQTDNTMGKAGKWVLYEFENSKGTGTGHNTKIYVMAAQIELFESYLLIAQKVLITGINWRKQSDSYFSTFSCYGPPNQCCYQASKTIVEQFGVTTDRTHSIDVTVLANPSTDYNTLSVTGNFETGLEYLKSTIKPNKQGGKPVVIGVHYAKNTAPFNANKATYHFVIVVGIGYDREKRKHYFRFYDVGKSNGTNPSFKLYVDEEKKEIAGYSEDRLYTVTEVRQNY